MINHLLNLQLSLPALKKYAKLALHTTAILALGTGVSDLGQADSLKPISSAEQASIIPSSTKLFEFHSAFWANLHHFLYVQARARMKTPDSRRRAVAGISADLATIGTMSSEERRQWEAALDYYHKNLATRDIIFDDRLKTISDVLAKQESADSLLSAEIDPTHKQILESAAKVYRVRWWPQHDLSNRDSEINGIWSNHSMAGYRKLLDEHWRPYLEQKTWNKADFEAAVKSIVKAL